MTEISPKEVRSPYFYKQVIVMRKDLNMRKGKMVAQGAHASLAVILDMMKKSYDEQLKINTYQLDLYDSSPIQGWLSGSFAKICISVDSEAELLEVYQKAKDVSLPTVLITDNGQTEFDGVPTKTCIAIGPWYRDEIDKITGHLKLL